MMKKSGIILSVIVLLGAWQFAAFSIHNDFLMPYPSDVFMNMIQQCQDSNFYTIVFHTLFRSLTGLFIAFLCAILCALLSYIIPFIASLLSPVILLAKSIPNISYIIIILVWFGSESSSMIIPFLILFPMIYTNLYQGITNLDQDTRDVMRLYPQTFWLMLKKVYFPLLLPAINISLTNGLGLAFKVGVMAEIIGQVQTGIGRQLNIARLNMNMTEIFAWTIWIILLLALVDYIKEYLMAKLEK